MMQDYEKLGAFYLGREYDLEQGKIREDLLLYDAKDLTTHAVCVGMTGSGKTGLCLGLLEEAAIDGIPAIAIDPKGDIGNLLLTFPNLVASDFRPWIDEAEAARKGMTPDEYAKKTAETWRKGLAEWGQDGSRIERFRQAADVAVYTPGSTAGLQVTVLRSFDAPPAALLADADAVRDRIQSAVSGLLALLGIDADPVRSREHILLSNLLAHAWGAGRNLGLADLIRDIQNPPFDKVGVFDLESFYPAADRFGLAMGINNLLASPGFSTWLEGEPLNIGSLLYTPEGRPRIAILSIAHLSESERMFFVTILLNELLAWVRTQSGTSSLRALLYMDEIFGFFPPTANPPSKKPMLTLLKQARAFGVGVVLATQNPVDLDYKGLSNTGTWFIGRLQTERDKLRVLDGLEGASASAGAGFDRGRMDTVLSSLGSRVFLMHNVHDNGPVVFHTRWALSYLRGPLTRVQIQALMAGRKPATTTPAAAAPAAAAAASAAAAVQAGEAPAAARPVVPAAVREYFLPPAGAVGSSSRLVYRPAILATARLHYVRAGANVDEWRDTTLLAETPEEFPDVDWESASVYPGDAFVPESSPRDGAAFGDLPAVATNPGNYAAWSRSLKDHLYQAHELAIYECKELKEVSRLGEAEGEFRGRLAHRAKEERDRQIEKLRQSYGSKLAVIQDRVRRAEERVQQEESQHGQQKMQTVISLGTTVIGALFGRRLTSATSVGRAATTMRGMGRAAREKEDIARAEAALEAQREKLAELEQAFEQEVEAMRGALQPELLQLETILVRPRKGDMQVKAIGLAWTPWRVDADGIAEPLFGQP